MKRFLTLAALAAAIGCSHAEPTTYAIDPTHTQVTWEVLHMGTSTLRGRFDKKDGSVQLDRAARTGKVDLTIDMTSVSTGIEGLNSELRSKEGFNVAANPSSRFVSDRLTFAGDKVTEAAGQLTLNGKTLPVTLKATNFNCYPNPWLKREVCGGDFEATIQRSQWGVSFGPGIASDSVRLLIQVEAIKQ